MMMREQPLTVRNCVTTMQCVNMPVTDCVTTMQCVNMPVTDCVTMHHAMEPLPYQQRTVNGIDANTPSRTFEILTSLFKNKKIQGLFG